VDFRGIENYEGTLFCYPSSGFEAADEWAVLFNTEGTVLFWRERFLWCWWQAECFQSPGPSLHRTLCYQILIPGKPACRQTGGTSPDETEVVVRSACRGNRSFMEQEDSYGG